ncbi:hypothetical protein OSB04_013168 [Centaurea solstitialis]|uniref:F-box domain-containing protein n=1 Tax=Centaurea solstitialis TaxID=347529 RepID=A0AA38TCR2_9ASTR|nr:hypothetical protein OSB04_013168 [Centaurea solstitialis]
MRVSRRKIQKSSQNGVYACVATVDDQDQEEGSWDEYVSWHLVKDDGCGGDLVAPDSLKNHNREGRHRCSRSLSLEIEIGMAVEELPDEVIVEILSILPAKSLLRCRLVCKCWLNLISSTKFKLMHLHNFNQLNPRYFVRRLFLVDFKVEECYDVHLDDEAFTLDRSTQIEFPFDRIRESYCFRIVGCCHGVVCLYDEDENISFSWDMVILWNPSIRRKLTLTLPIFNPIKSSVVLGFGYDKVSDDFKVVSLTYDWSSFSTRPKVEVYIVKTGFWRKVVFPGDLRCFNIQSAWSQIFSNGCVHWIARDPTPGVSRYSIMTYDVTTELFGEIQLPEFSDEKHLLRVSVVGESLAAIYLHHLGSGSAYVVMVMKEYKNPNSWTMLYSTQYTGLAMWIPLRLRNNGDMIVELENRDMVMFNHNDGRYVYVFRGGEEGCYSNSKTCVDRYEESLALLDVGDSIPNKEAMEALMMIQNQGMRL